MAAASHIVGVILAGGGSRRFGGGDKGLSELAGKSILSHVIGSFEPQVAKLVLSANGDPARFGALGLDVVPDDKHTGLGPLSGILAALSWMRIFAPEAKALATTTADAPFIPDDLVAKLDQARTGAPAIAVSNGRRHPTMALWPIEIYESVDLALAKGHLSVDRFASNASAVEVTFPMRQIVGRDFDPFFNINTKDDLEAARAALELKS